MIDIKMVKNLGMFFFFQPADLKKIMKTVDEALCRGAENLAQLEHIYKVKAALDP